MKKRTIFGVIALALFLIELYIALFAEYGFIRAYFGDFLVVILIYCLVRIFLPDKPFLLPLYVFLFSVFVELMQYIDIVALLGLENNSLISTLVGRHFSFGDIICYFCGCLVCAIYEIIIYLIRKNHVRRVFD